MGSHSQCMFNKKNTKKYKAFEILLLACVTAVVAQMCIYLQAFDNGDIFPIWAECLGLELVSLLVGKRNLSLGQFDTEFFTEVDAQNISLPLILPKGLLAL